MVIPDRLWRLVFLFWWFSAAALVLGMVSKPLLRSVVEKDEVRPMAMVTPAESSSARTVIVPPPAVARLDEHFIHSASRAHHIRHSRPRFAEIAPGESVKAPTTT